MAFTIKKKKKEKTLDEFYSQYPFAYGAAQQAQGNYERLEKQHKNL